MCNFRKLNVPFGLQKWILVMESFLEMCHFCKGFCQVGKIQKIRELGSGWVCQASTLIFLFFWKFCVFLCFYFAVHVSKKNKKIGWGWLGGV